MKVKPAWYQWELSFIDLDPHFLGTKHRQVEPSSTFINVNPTNDYKSIPAPCSLNQALRSSKSGITLSSSFQNAAE